MTEWTELKDISLFIQLQMIFFFFDFFYYYQTDIVNIKILSFKFFSPKPHCAHSSCLPPQSFYVC